MTFSLRKKRPITVPAPRTSARTESEWVPEGGWSPFRMSTLTCLAIVGLVCAVLATDAFVKAEPTAPVPLFPPPAPFVSSKTLPNPASTQPFVPATIKPIVPAAPYMLPAQAPKAATTPVLAPKTVTAPAPSKPAPVAQTVPSMAGQPAAPVFQRILYQPPPASDAATPGEDAQDVPTQLRPPGPDQLFGHLESQSALFERMRQQALQRSPPERIVFPEEPVITRENFTPRMFRPSREVVEPSYLCHRRLYFEQPNLERYGWDLGFITPFVSTGRFFYDTALLPYHFGTDVCRCHECSSGKCLPGDPVPLMIYPPQLSVTGALFEAGAIVALCAIFPG